MINDTVAYESNEYGKAQKQSEILKLDVLERCAKRYDAVLSLLDCYRLKRGLHLSYGLSLKIKFLIVFSAGYLTKLDLRELLAQ